MIIGARLSIRLRLPLAAVALLCFSLPVDADAKKRRGGAHKVERRIDKGSPGAKRSPKPPAADEADEDDAGSVTAREQGQGGPDEDAGGDAASDSAVARDGDGDGEAKTAAAAPPPRADQRRRRRRGQRDGRAGGVGGAAVDGSSSPSAPAASLATWPTTIRCRPGFANTSWRWARPWSRTSPSTRSRWRRAAPPRASASSPTSNRPSRPRRSSRPTRPSRTAPRSRPRCTSSPAGSVIGFPSAPRRSAWRSRAGSTPSGSSAAAGRIAASSRFRTWPTSSCAAAWTRGWR